MIKINDFEKNIKDSEIIEFEINWNIKLPKNYKSFLKKYNGGVIYDFHPYLNSFNSLKYEESNTLLENAYNIYNVLNEDLDKEYLPIASSHSGNPITLCLKQGEYYGKIILFYFDRDQEPEVIANSLEELLGVNSIDEL
jgi:hypothetical protein